MRQFNWTREIDLQQWADSLDARQRSPQLLRRLILSTIESDWIRRINFPAGEGVQRPGWDGIVDTARGNAFVPEGVSGWEIGADKDIHKKADKEFDSRSTNPLGLDPGQTTFVFVTPRKWSSKDEWIKAKNKLGLWRDVRVYDSTNLEQWLEIAVSVDIWLARIIGKRPTGVMDISEYWENILSLTQPSLRPSLFLTNREDSVKRVAEWLTGPPAAIAFDTHSSTDVIDFLSAILASKNDIQSNIHEVRTVLVEDNEAWRALTGSCNRLILVPFGGFEVTHELVAHAVRCDHYVLIGSHQFASDSTKQYKLILPNKIDLRNALIDSGRDDRDAEWLAEETSGAITILKRLVSQFPSTSRPAWSKSSDVLMIAPMLLSGGWDDASNGDREVMEKLSGYKYRDFLANANRLITLDDSPITCIGTEWKLFSREDSWVLCASSLTREELDEFHKIVLEVLTEDDPRYDLPPEERWAASMHKKDLTHSSQLRSGIAQTLALLGARTPEGIVANAVLPTRRADGLVRELLQSSNWRRWASLSEYLPVLAEASPDSFLVAVENDLKQPIPQLSLLFQEGDDPFFSSSPHTGLLWALETLAWEPAYLTRVSLILANLADHDPGGRLVNRPQNSLHEIFLPWLPQTSASSQQRLEVLMQLTKMNPSVSRKLLYSLLPKGPGISHPTRIPYWRKAWVNIPYPRIISPDYRQQVENISKLIIANLNNAGEEWLTLIEEIDHFPEVARDEILNLMKRFKTNTFDVGLREKIWDQLREKVQKHRYYFDAQWALPSKVIDELEWVQNILQPEDQVERWNWLFNSHTRLTEISRDQPWEMQDKAIFEKRRQILDHIYKSEGLQSIRRLAECVQQPEIVGYVFGKAELSGNDNDILPHMLTEGNPIITQFAEGYASGRYATKGWDWLNGQRIGSWTPAQVGKIANIMPFEKKTWDYIKQFGQEYESKYWCQVYPWARNLTPEAIEEAISLLLMHNRPWQAIKILSDALYNNCPLKWEVIAQTLEMGLKSQSEEGEIRDSMNSSHVYEIQRLFEYLQGMASVDQNRLAVLEWGFLPVLDNNEASPKALYGLLKEKPNFFVELLQLLYRPKNQPAPKDNINDEDKIRARLADNLLSSWRILPGTLENGSVDGTLLNNWLNEARRLAKEADLVEVFDIKVGELFAYSPLEADGSWPCVAVRELIENTGSERMVRGFKMGIYNRRGTFCKSLTEGGRQEIDLANQYHGYAEICKIKWPTTSAALRGMARDYEDEARREDDEARKR